MFRTTTGIRLCLATMLVLAAGPIIRAADDDAALRKRALALNEITGDKPITGEIRVLTDDKEGTKKLLAVALKMNKENQPFNFNAAWILGVAAEDVKDVEGSAAFLRVAADQALKLKSPSKLLQAHAGLVAVYYGAEKYDEALKVCQDFLEIPEEKERADPDQDAYYNTSRLNNALRRGKDRMRRQLVQILVKQGKVDEAHKIIDRLLKSDPEDLDALELRADVQREAEQYDDAAKTYEEMIAKINEAVERVKKDTELAKPVRDDFVKRFNAEARTLRYRMSGVYTDANKIDKAIGVLQDLLKEDPDNPGYNNDLGYIMADHDMKLDEAEKLIRKAIDEDKKQQEEEIKKLKAENPDLPAVEVKANAAYLDSLGWVLYKKGKFKEALPPLLEAVKEPEGEHIEIFDHLADVHMKLGDKKAALEAWKKGIEKVGTTKREQQRKTIVEKKIKENS
jgi:tetratricopeptide (TPR) repeat protein